MKKGLILGLLICCNLLCSQEIKNLESQLSKMRNDSAKVNLYQKIARSYSSKDSAKTFLLLNKSLQLAQKLNWKDGESKALLQIGENHLDYYNNAKALSNFQLALTKSKNPKIRASIYFSIGELFLEESNYAKALANYHESLRLYETVKDNAGIVKVLVSIGSLYTGFGKNKEALETYNKALMVSKGLNHFKEDMILRGLGTVHYNYGNYQKSLDYLTKSLALIRTKKDTNLESRLLSDIALVFLEMKDYQKAIRYSHASLKTDFLIKTKKHNASFSYGVIGDSYIELAKEYNDNQKYVDSAIFYLEKAAALHRELRSLRGLYDDYESIYEAQKLKGNYSKALEYLELSALYKDSMYNSDNRETIKNLEDKRTIELRNRELKINKLQLEAKEKQKWFLVVGLALLGIIGSLLFYQNRNRKKTNEKLLQLNTELDSKNHELDEANQIKARFFALLNHDLRSPVYNLIHFLHLQKESPELLDKAMKDSIQNKTMVSAENLLQSMEDMLLWSKGQMENFKPNPQPFQIAQLFDDTQKHFSGVENILFFFENPMNLAVTTDENYLKTIVRNLTGNAIKALQNTTIPSAVEGQISWKAYQEDDKTFLSISDNGPGTTLDKFKALYDEKEVVGIKTGLGMHLIRDLAKAINCTIHVDSEPGKGTTITLTL